MLGEDNKTLLEAINLLKGENALLREQVAGQGRVLLEILDQLKNQNAAPLVIHGRCFESVTKSVAARRLSLSIAAFDDLVSKGYLPQPFAPDDRVGKGKKILRWDVYEVIEKFMSYRRN